MRTLPRACAIIQAPSGLGLKPSGVELLPGALLELGLAEDLRATRSLRMELPAHRFEQDQDTGVLNAAAIAEWTPHLADAVESVLDRGEFPLILGGDCSILLGSALALRRRGRYGVLFIDGHTDFYQPEAEPNGEAASMELAFATGRGPLLLTNLEGRESLVQDEDVVAFGFRDADEQAAYGARPLPPALLAFDYLLSVKLALSWRPGLPSNTSPAMNWTVSSSTSTSTCSTMESCRRWTTGFLAG